MIIIKNNWELDSMRKAGRISALALEAGLEAVRPGITTAAVNQAIHKVITAEGAIPSFLGYNGFPAAACISVNEEVIHGIPGSRVIEEGDIVSIDVGAIFEGFHGDNAATIGAGKIPPQAAKLLEVTKASLMQAIGVVKPDCRIGDISAAVQEYAESFGYGVVRDFVGHGVGRDLHESPEVPNYGRAGRGVRLSKGMTIAIEPMINAGDWQVEELEDNWTIVSCDRSLSAHFEHTIAVTENGAEILTVAR